MQQLYASLGVAAGALCSLRALRLAFKWSLLLLAAKGAVAVDVRSMHSS